MKISTALVTFTACFTIASAVPDVAEDDMILTAHEGLIVMNNHIARDFTAQEQGIIDSCLMTVFNEVHDPAVAALRLVSDERTSPFNLASSVFERKEVVGTGNFPAYRTYTRLLWKKFYANLCRLCLPCGPEEQPWLCTHPEEAKLLSPHERFKAIASSHQLEWETGTCDCLARTGLKVFEDVSSCVLTFSPVSDEIPLDSHAMAVEETVIDQAMMKDEEVESDSDDLVHTRHETVVLFTSHITRDSTEEEDNVVNTCLMDTFNALHEGTVSTIEKVSSEGVSTRAFFDDMSSDIKQRKGLRYSYKLRWLLLETMSCKMCLPDCEDDSWSNPVTSRYWLCDHREKALLLPSKERAKLSMTWMHNMWQLDLCSCLLNSEMELFQGVQNCVITFPPMTEDTYDSSIVEAE
jgi:hypothetical protein